jgi:hypothetical protein
MAVKNIAVTDTLETFRTTFNDLAANDFGDIADLSGAISATSIVGAMNETISIATSSAGFTIEDSSSTQQIVGGGDTLRVFGTSNEIEAVVSATDTLTIGLPSVVSITTSVTSPTLSTGNMSLTNGSITDSSGSISFGNENLTTTGTLNAGAITGTSITGSGATHTLGTIQISGNTISSTDSTTMIIDDHVSLSSGKILTLDKISSANTFIDFGTVNLSTDGHYYTATTGTGGFIFEGSTPDSSETSLYAIDPTADRTIALPDESGTIITTGSTDAITESMMGTDSIGQNELKTLVTLQILNSSGTVLKTLYGAGA